jgi:hypothetical protein
LNRERRIGPKLARLAVGRKRRGRRSERRNYLNGMDLRLG